MKNENQTQSKHTPDAIRFAPLRVVESDDAGNWLVMTRQDETPGTLNNFSLAECQHQTDAILFASAPDLLRQRDELRHALEIVIAQATPTQTLPWEKTPVANLAQTLDAIANHARAALANATESGVSL